MNTSPQASSKGQTMTISTIMTRDHRVCDEAFFRLESAALNKDWATCERAVAQFVRGMRHHFDLEEERLFPAFEQATGMANGPTAVMRLEHVQMRTLFTELEAAVAGRDAKGVDGLCETILIMMQQHNLKEENVLYPMLDRALPAGEADHLEKDLAEAA